MLLRVVEATVVIPTRDRAALLRTTLATVSGQAERVLVVDDGSSDDTAAVVAEAGAELLRNWGRCRRAA